MMSAELLKTFETEGRVWFRNALRPDALCKMDASLSSRAQPGARHAENSPLSQAIEHLDVVKKLQNYWPGMRPVRIVSFEKTPETNWGVPWHQDRVISVNQQADMPGFSNWSKKQGRWHCEPPEPILRNMLFVRIHLDPNTAENGAMEIAVGSHKAGLVTIRDAEKTAERYDREITTCVAGDVLVLNMLTLHRSRPSRNAAPRRAIRVDFSPDTLPAPLEWAL